MYSLVFLWCVVAIATADNCDKSRPKRDSIFASIDSGEVHNDFDESKHNEDEIRSAFPVMNAFKDHTLLTADDLKDKKEYEYADQDTIDAAVRNALRKLHKHKKLYSDAIAKANADDMPQKDVHAPKKNITARELVDQVVKDELKKHHSKNHDALEEEINDSMNDSPAEDEKKSFESTLHKKLKQISSLENKLTHLVRDVKKYLKKKKAEDPSNYNIGALEDNDDVDRILAFSSSSNKKRSEIPTRSHIALIQKFRNNPELVDKYIDNILDTKDASTTNGEQRDLLGKKETESALLRDAVPNGEINSIPLSRLDKESDDYDSMATDRGIARDALIESPFSMLDVKKTTGKKFRHDIT